MKKKSISIVIPAYNEGKGIEKILKVYHDYFKKQGVDFELIAVPNNCSDDTPEIAKNFAKNKKEIRIHNIPYFVGKGGAVLEGFKIAKSDLVGFVDADLATAPDAFFDLYKNLDNYDAILASRWIKGANILVKQPLSRRIASRGFNFLVRAFFGIPARDTQCGAKLFKKEPVLKVIPFLDITKWAFDIDLLFHLKRSGYKMKEIPTTWHEPGNTHLKIGKTSFEMGLAIARLRLVYSPFRFIVSLYDHTLGKKV